MASEHSWLITYDIAEPRRLQRVARIMENHGVRLQKSVFECLLRPADLQRLLRKIAREIDHEVDGVKCFPLCKSCEQRCTLLGSSSDSHQSYTAYLIT